MVLCFAADCNHQTVRNTCKFYRFPKDKKLWKVWENKSRRADRRPGPDARLCSCHFKDGLKQQEPTIFTGRIDKSMQFTSPEKRRRKQISANIPEEIRTTVEISVQNEAADNDESSSKPGSGASSMHSTDILLCQLENESLKQEVENLKTQLKYSSTRFTFTMIHDRDSLVLHYTGLPNSATFYTLAEYCRRFEFNYFYGSPVNDLNFEEQLFLTLFKLRRNPTFLDLSLRFSVSDKAVRNVFITFVHLLHAVLFQFVMQDYEHFPSLSKARLTSPACFTSFRNCRFIIDCTEVSVQVPRSSMDAQSSTYSSYKHCNTFKVMIAVAPNGSIIFVSDFFTGSTSDKEIFCQSGITKLLQPGEVIIADKGFKIYDAVPQGVSVNIPPFLINPQFTKQEAKLTTQIARARVHVERAIRRVKTFQLIRGPTHHQFRPIAQMLFQTIAALVNLQYPLLKEILGKQLT